MFASRLRALATAGALVLFAFPAPGHAITLGLTDIAGFSMLSSSDPGTITVNNGIVPDGSAVTLTTIFAPPQIGQQSASVGLAGLNIAFNGGDLFGLHITNTNENAWVFQLVAVTDQGTFMSGASALIPDTGDFYHAALGGVAGTISSVFFVISGSVPFPDGDRTAEYEIAPVPIPPALALFGGGLVGLGLLSRRRRKHPASIAG
jgi:hypothetical protein